MKKIMLILTILFCVSSSIILAGVDKFPLFWEIVYTAGEGFRLDDFKLSPHEMKIQGYKERPIIFSAVSTDSGEKVIVSYTIEYTIRDKKAKGRTKL